MKIIKQILSFFSRKPIRISKNKLWYYYRGKKYSRKQLLENSDYWTDFYKSMQ